LEYAIIAGILLASYLIGSIPFGLLIGRVFYKKDIRDYGSGNIGATNAYRTLGPVPGIAVFLADFLKGFVPALAAKVILQPIDPNIVPLISILAGVVSMTGHNYSVFLKFEGGKGMSTAAGFIAAIWPLVMVILLLVWITVIAITRYVSLASIIVAVLFPVIVIFLQPLPPYVIFSVLTAIVGVYRHRSNIKRLINGTELKIGSKAKKKEEVGVDSAE
jgi:glycerol-3-phosphate acyltransferase PlsY